MNLLARSACKETRTELSFKAFTTSILFHPFVLCFLYFSNTKSGLLGGSRIICLERHSDFAGVINFSLRRKKPGVCEKSWVWTRSIRLHEQKLPPKQWTKLFYFIKNLNSRLNKAWYFFSDIEVRFFVQSYASLGHFAQNLLVLCANLE